MKKDKKEKETPEKTANQADMESNTQQAAGEADNVNSTETAAVGTEQADSRAEAAEKEMVEWKDRYVRLLAEYDNYRKRTAKEKESFYAMAKADAVERFLPVYDNIERAVAIPTQDEAYKKGVEMIMQQLRDGFRQLGVCEIEAAGVQFDPEKHNAVMHIEDESLGENCVAEVFQRGFEIDGKVIRHAVVKVAN